MQQFDPFVEIRFGVKQWVVAFDLGEVNRSLLLE